MEGESSRLEIHTPVFDKKKKKYSVYKEGHLRHPHESVRDSPLASEPSHVTKSKKKKKDCQHLLPSPLKKSEIGGETKKATSVPKKNKKKKHRASEMDEETGVVYVLVDKENIENTPKNFRRDVDVVYVDMSQEQKPAKEPEADELHSVPKSHKNESEELHRKVRETKSRKHRRKVASWDAEQESLRASLALPKSEPHKQETLLSVGPGGGIPQLPASGNKKKSKKKKRKIAHHQELEALPGPESLESVYSEGWQGVGEVGTAEGSKEAGRVKKKSKKRKRRSSLESPVAPGGDFSVPAERFEDTHPDSLEGNGALIEERAKPRPQEEKTQACLEEVQR